MGPDIWAQPPCRVLALPAAPWGPGHLGALWLPYHLVLRDPPWSFDHVQCVAYRKRLAEAGSVDRRCCEHFSVHWRPVWTCWTPLDPPPEALPLVS